MEGNELIYSVNDIRRSNSFVVKTHIKGGPYSNLKCPQGQVVAYTKKGAICRNPLPSSGGGGGGSGSSGPTLGDVACQLAIMGGGPGNC
ncbi:MAG: hypothetical protein HQK79_15490 [Desulfobacterales bacterium]|nr:hypothetical protein [Desulfobacterales bacterium]